MHELYVSSNYCHVIGTETLQVGRDMMRIGTGLYDTMQDDTGRLGIRQIPIG